MILHFFITTWSEEERSGRPAKIKGRCSTRMLKTTKKLLNVHTNKKRCEKACSVSKSILDVLIDLEDLDDNFETNLTLFRRKWYSS